MNVLQDPLRASATAAACDAGPGHESLGSALSRLRTAVDSSAVLQAEARQYGDAWLREPDQGPGQHHQPGRRDLLERGPRLQLLRLSRQPHARPPQGRVLRRDARRIPTPGRPSTPAWASASSTSAPAGRIGPSWWRAPCWWSSSAPCGSSCWRRECPSGTSRWCSATSPGPAAYDSLLAAGRARGELRRPRPAAHQRDRLPAQADRRGEGAPLLADAARVGHQDPRLALELVPLRRPPRRRLPARRDGADRGAGPGQRAERGAAPDDPGVGADDPPARRAAGARRADRRRRGDAAARALRHSARHRTAWPAGCRTGTSTSRTTPFLRELMPFLPTGWPVVGARRCRPAPSGHRRAEAAPEGAVPRHPTDVGRDRAAPEWHAFMAAYLAYRQATYSAGQRADPGRLAPAGLQDIAAADLRAHARRAEGAAEYVIMGSQNQDYRGMFMDGEVDLLFSGPETLVPLVDLDLPRGHGPPGSRPSSQLEACCRRRPSTGAGWRACSRTAYERARHAVQLLLLAGLLPASAQAQLGEAHFGAIGSYGTGDAYQGRGGTHRQLPPGRLAYVGLRWIYYGGSTAQHHRLRPGATRSPPGPSSSAPTWGSSIRSAAWRWWAGSRSARCASGRAPRRWAPRAPRPSAPSPPSSSWRPPCWLEIPRRPASCSFPRWPTTSRASPDLRWPVGHDGLAVTLLVVIPIETGRIRY